MQVLRTAVASLFLTAILLTAITSPASAKPEVRRVAMLGLKRDEKSLASFVAGASTPGSPSYGNYLTLGQLRTRFGAKGSVRKRVLSFLRRDPGVRSVQLDSTGTVVLARLSARSAERLFCARGMRPPRHGLCLPRALRGAVAELDLGGSYKAKPAKRAARASADPTGTPQGCKAALESGTFTPNQIRSAYGVDELAGRGLDGSGVRVVTLSGATVDVSELRKWASCFGQPAPAFHQFSMPSASTETSTAPEETYLDAEALSTMAPRLERITAINVPLVSSFQSAFPLFMLGALDPSRQAGRLPDVLSISDAVCESQLSRADVRLGQHLLRDAAALGITALGASGDLGFLGCQEKAKGASWPASSQYVVAVGGTEIALGTQNQLTDQLVWSTFGTEGESNGTGSGGGPSILWPRPSWQSGPGIGPVLQPKGTNRLTPDIAAMGSFTPGLATLGGGEGGWGPGGGTSTATPLEAAIVALTLQQERLGGRPALGSLNPLIFELAAGSSYSQVFSDVVEGTSSPKPKTPLGQSPSGGAAQPGYDLATGFGSLRAGSFAAAVASRPLAP